MEGILQAHDHLERKGNLSKAIDDVQRAIELLQTARTVVIEDPETAVLTMAKLKQPMKTSFDKLDDDLKEINKGLNQYQKALDKKFKKSALPTASTGPLVEQPNLINRAIMMHLLREGQFDVANVFEREMQEQARARNVQHESDILQHWLNEDSFPEQRTMHQERSWLQERFAEMYTILDSLRNQHDLGPAIKWAKEHSIQLEQRGSNLEWHLCRLRFIELYTSNDIMSEVDGQLRALQYAQSAFQNFNSRYMRELTNLIGSLAYSTELDASPYRGLFFNETAWEDASSSFTREFCGLLGLSENSPLYTAVTAGGIALPVLEKLERIVAETGGQWTSPNELPVETPLPRSFKFHSIFVCPVSKEQGTDDNPPMMLPCGHVIAQQSLEQHARARSKVKCPYCPLDFQVKEARRIFI